MEEGPYRVISSPTSRDRLDWFHRHHLDLLEEWNEDTVFSATTTAILSTDLGVQVVQDVSQRNRCYEDGQFVGLGKPELIQVWAIYGDEDELKRLIVAENGHGRRGPSNQVLVNQVIRG